MYCIHCGKPIGNSEKICTHCNEKNGSVNQTNEPIVLNKTVSTVRDQCVKKKTFWTSCINSKYRLLYVLLALLLLIGPRAVSYYQNTDSYIEAQNQKASEKLLEEIDILIKSAQADYQSGDYDMALSKLNELLVLTPDNAEALDLKSQTLTLAVEALCKQAEIARDEGWYVEPYDMVVKALSYDPTNAKAERLRVELLPLRNSEQALRDELAAEKDLADQEFSDQYDAEKQARIANLLEKYKFDGELAVAIRLEDGTFYTGRYGSGGTDGSGNYFYVSDWSEDFGYQYTHKVYDTGEIDMVYDYSEEDAEQHIEAMGTLIEKEVVPETPENTFAEEAYYICKDENLQPEYYPHISFLKDGSYIFVYNFYEGMDMMGGTYTWDKVTNEITCSVSEEDLNGAGFNTFTILYGGDYLEITDMGEGSFGTTYVGDIFTQMDEQIIFQWESWDEEPEITKYTLEMDTAYGGNRDDLAYEMQPQIVFFSDGSFDFVHNRSDYMYATTGTYTVDKSTNEIICTLNELDSSQLGIVDFQLLLGDGYLELLRIEGGNVSSSIREGDILYKVDNESSPQAGSTGFIHPESMDSVYFTDGTQIEFFADSAPLLCYALKDYTGIQMKEFYNTFSGQYIFFNGTVGDISSDGSIRVQCLDEVATKKLDLLWPLQAFVDVKTNASEQTLLSITDGMEITMIAQIQDQCYSSFLGVLTLELENGIILDIA